jgi:hypothetical protein
VLWCDTNVSEVRAASIFRVKERNWHNMNRRLNRVRRKEGRKEGRKAGIRHAKLNVKNIFEVDGRNM